MEIDLVGLGAALGVEEAREGVEEEALGEGLGGAVLARRFKASRCSCFVDT